MASSRPGGVQARLLSELEYVLLDVGGRASLVGADETDPGTMDWSAKAVIQVWPDDEDLADSEPPWHTLDGAALSVADDGAGCIEVSIWEASGLLVDLAEVGDVYDALDARSQDYENFARVFGRHREMGVLLLADDLEERLQPLGSSVVIIDRVRIAPAWRGLGGVGRYLTGRVLSWLGRDARLVAVNPFPIDLDFGERENRAVFEPALDRVRRTWASLGFTEYADGIWIMDPGLAIHEKSVSKLERRLGLRRHQ